MVEPTGGEWTLLELPTPISPFGRFIVRSTEAPGGLALSIGGLGEEEKANAILFASARRLLESAIGVLDYWYGCGDHCRNNCQFCRLRAAVEAAKGS